MKPDMAEAYTFRSFTRGLLIHALRIPKMAGHGVDRRALPASIGAMEVARQHRPHSVQRLAAPTWHAGIEHPVAARCSTRACVLSRAGGISGCHVLAATGKNGRA